MTYTTQELREKITTNGWVLRELPIRTGGAGSALVRAYKLIAINKDRSFTLEGKTLDDALAAMCKMLGLIRR